jgi:demethylsterigmatocystin 6-O-methyltransferase
MEISIKTEALTGAKFYYLRAVLHGHSDDKAILILKNIMAAMDPDSLILLDEMVLLNQNVDWFATQTDLTMLAALGSMERTEAQWYRLLEIVGLKVQGICTYTHAFRLSVIAASL